MYVPGAEARTVHAQSARPLHVIKIEDQNEQSRFLQWDDIREPGAAPRTVHGESARLFPRIKIEDEDRKEKGENDDDDLVYEENILIKIEQQIILQPWRRQRLQFLAPAMLRPMGESPFLDLFVERFIDAFAPDERDDCGSSSAIRKAGSVRMFSPLLNEAFQAVSMAYWGQSTGSARVMAQCYRRYCLTLDHLQQALVDPEQSRLEGVFATVILLMAYESLQHTSEKALIGHCMGALKLIEFRNPWNHMFGIEHLCFVELLPYWVSTAIVMRKPSFLAKKEWKTVPWSAKGCRKDIMAHLLEEVVDLPAILWRYDQYNLALQTQSKSPYELNASLHRLCTSIGELDARLRRWKRDWADTYPFGRPHEVHRQGPGAFPVFSYFNPGTLDAVTPPTLVYPDPQIARTLGMYYTAMILLSSVDARSTGTIRATRALRYAHLICRSMEYYIRSVPGNMINRMAFPLRVAYDSLPAQGLERRFVEEIFQLVGRKHALRSWGKFVPDLSTKA